MITEPAHFAFLWLRLADEFGDEIDRITIVGYPLRTERLHRLYRWRKAARRRAVEAHRRAST